MNWRAIGCGTLAAGVFILLGVFAIWRAGAPPGCPTTLPYEPASYRPAGDPADQPTLAGIEEPLEQSGYASFGLARWEVWVEPGRAPAASGDLLPQRNVLACGAGTYQAYHRGTE